MNPNSGYQAEGSEHDRCDCTEPRRTESSTGLNIRAYLLEGDYFRLPFTKYMDTYQERDVLDPIEHRVDQRTDSPITGHEVKYRSHSSFGSPDIGNFIW